MSTQNKASTHQGSEAASKQGAFYRGVRVGPLAVALLGVIGTAVAVDRRLKAESRGQGARRLHCCMPLGFMAVLPEIEPHWQAWFWLGALFGAGAWVLYRMVQWVDQDMRQEKMDGHGRESVEASQARQRARVLTESEHRELLLTALADAMRNPMRRVDIRGIPALWALTEAQKAVWLAWLRGKEMEWAGHHWVATVERVGHLVLVRFELSTEGGSLSGEIQARKQTDKIIVARGRASRS